MSSDYHLLRAKSNNMKSFLYKTSDSDPFQNQKLYKNFTNPMPGKVFNPPPFSISEADSLNPSSQDEIALNIDEAFYRKVEWKKNEGPLQDSLDIFDNLKISQDSNLKTQEILNSQIISSSGSSKKTVLEHVGSQKVKTLNKEDLADSLKKLDMIINQKNFKKKTPPKLVADSQIFKMEKKDTPINYLAMKEESKIEMKPIPMISDDKRPSENDIAASQLSKASLTNNTICKEESVKMQEIIKEAHIQLFDPNSIGQIDPATYTNPLFLIGGSFFFNF